MKVTLTLECNCGNTITHSAKNKYHEDVHAVYVDMTETIYDHNFRVKHTEVGVWVHCEKCDNGCEIA